MQSPKEKAVELACLIAAMLSEEHRAELVPTDYTGLEREAAMFIADRRASRVGFDRWLEKRLGIVLENGEKVQDAIQKRLVHNSSLQKMEATGDKWAAIQMRFYEAVERKRERRKKGASDVH